MRANATLALVIFALLLASMAGAAQDPRESAEQILAHVTELFSSNSNYTARLRAELRTVTSRAELLEFYNKALRIIAGSGHEHNFLQRTYDMYQQLNATPAERHATTLAVANQQKLEAKLTPFQFLFFTWHIAPHSALHRSVMDLFLALPEDVRAHTSNLLFDETQRYIVDPQPGVSEHRQFLNAYNRVLAHAHRNPEKHESGWMQREIARVNHFVLATRDVYRRHHPTAAEMVETANAAAVPSIDPWDSKFLQLPAEFSRHPVPQFQFLLAQLEYTNPEDANLLKQTELLTAIREESKKAQRWDHVPLRERNQTLPHHRDKFQLERSDFVTKIRETFERSLPQYTVDSSGIDFGKSTLETARQMLMGGIPSTTVNPFLLKSLGLAAHPDAFLDLLDWVISHEVWKSPEEAENFLRARLDAFYASSPSPEGKLRALEMLRPRQVPWARARAAGEAFAHEPEKLRTELLAIAVDHMLAGNDAYASATFTHTRADLYPGLQGEALLAAIARDAQMTSEKRLPLLKRLAAEMREPIAHQIIDEAVRALPFPGDDYLLDDFNWILSRHPRGEARSDGLLYTELLKALDRELKWAQSSHLRSSHALQSILADLAKRMEVSARRFSSTDHDTGSFLLELWRDLWAQRRIDASAGLRGVLATLEIFPDTNRALSDKIVAAMRKQKYDLDIEDRVRLARASGESPSRRTDIRDALAEITRDPRAAYTLGRPLSHDFTSALEDAFPEGETGKVRLAMLLRETIARRGVPPYDNIVAIFNSLAEGEPDLAAAGIARATFDESRRLRWRMGEPILWMNKIGGVASCHRRGLWARITGSAK